MKAKRKAYAQEEPALTNRTTIKVRFSEVDAMKIVWHGTYIRYFEDGREAFGAAYGLDYWSIYNEGFVAPIVELDCQYKQPLTFGEEAVIETRYMKCDTAKIRFEYVVYKAADLSVVATGSSTQVFLNANNRELELLNPAFYVAWKKRWNII